MSHTSLELIAMGMIYASICVKADQSNEEIERLMNTLHPTGISSQWRIASDTHFRTGQTNPCQCETHEDRKHYLMSC